MFLKISSGFLKGRRFKVPSTDLRPTSEKVRSAFFNSLFSVIEFQNRSFLDLFSGSGAFAFEAISRGFKDACSVEKEPVSVKQIRFSSEELDLCSQVDIFCQDVFKMDFGSIGTKKFSAVYIDPPYILGEKIPELLEKIIQSDIIDKFCVICVEGSSFTDWTKEGWTNKGKKFGDTFLTFFYSRGLKND